jgi:hypothetical protein
MGFFSFCQGYIYMNWSGQVKKCSSKAGKGMLLLRKAYTSAFFIDSGVGTSLVSEGEGEERDKADLDFS